MIGVLTNFSICREASGVTATGLLLMASNDSVALRFGGVNAEHAERAQGRRISVSGERGRCGFTVRQFSVLAC